MSLYVYSFLIPLFHFFRVVSTSNTTITLGGNSDYLSVVPAVTWAGKNDTLVFAFAGGNHSLVQGDFDNPCVAKEGGFSTPFIPAMTGDVRHISPFLLKL